MEDTWKLLGMKNKKDYVFWVTIQLLWKVMHIHFNLANAMQMKLIYKIEWHASVKIIYITHVQLPVFCTPDK